MKTKNLLFLFLLLAQISFSQMQQDFTNKQNSIILFKGKYVVNNHYLTKNHLHSLILAHPSETIKSSLLIDYNVWKKKKKISRNMFIAGSSILLAGIATMVYESSNTKSVRTNPNNPNDERTTKNLQYSPAVLFTALGFSTYSSITGLVYNNKAKKYHHKMIDAYNQNIPNTLPANLDGFVSINQASGEAITTKISKIQRWKGLGFRHYYSNNIIFNDDELKIKLDAFPNQKMKEDLLSLYNNKKRYAKNERLSYLIGLIGVVPGALIGTVLTSDNSNKDAAIAFTAFGGAFNIAVITTAISYKVKQKKCQKAIVKLYNNE